MQHIDPAITAMPRQGREQADVGNVFPEKLPDGWGQVPTGVIQGNFLKERAQGSDLKDNTSG
jgi:hypothetical protein